MSNLSNLAAVVNHGGAMEADIILNWRNPKSHTSRNVFKFFVAVFFVSSIILAGCDEDKDKDDAESEEISTINKITATVEGGSQYNDKVSKVKFVIDGSQYFVLATGNYSNGGFTIELPQTVDAKYLEELDFSSSVTVSNENAKILWWTYFGGVDADDEYFCEFIYGKLDKYTWDPYYASDFTNVLYIYVDSNVNISGTETDGTKKLSIHLL